MVALVEMKDNRQKLILFSLLVWLASATSVAAQSEQGAPAANYRVLEWQELVPEGWEPPLVPPAHNELAKQGVDPSSVVLELGQKLVTLPGYMRPVVFEGNVVSEFLLVPFLPHQIKQHAHLEPNQMVYVSLIEPVPVDNPLEPVWVVGTMTLDAVFTDEGLAAYSIGDALMTEYRY